MSKELLNLLSGELLDEDRELTLAQLSRACRVPADRLLGLVEEGVIEPRGRNPIHWRFSGVSVKRARCALRLEHDLGLNLAGAALALDLLEEIENLRARLRRCGAGG
jgi:chaperone modulatory protein CbpM